MQRYVYLLSLFLALLAAGCQSDSSIPQKENTVNGRYEAEIDRLIGEMSIKEKVGQMTQLNLDVVGVGGIYALEEPHRLDTAKLRKAIVDYAVGSILNCGGHAYPREQWHELIGGIQRMATEETRLKIPVLYGIDAIHGANYTMGSTLFPQQLAQAATWNPALVEAAAEATAYEVRASGIPWNFSPVLDLARDPRWSRFFETYGEDVLLCKTMGEACIRGYQGDSLSDPTRVAACMKHFLGYSAPRTGKDRTPVYIAERQLREYFLPSFQAAIEAGAATVMINSGEMNGVPVHADKRILTDLLRNELKFDGLAVTDWEDIMKLNNIHKVAPTMKDAVRMAIDAGIDMSMVPNDFVFSDLLLELVEEGSISEARLDESVRRILRLKFELGLFDNPLPPSIQDYPEFNGERFQAAARAAADEAIVLLKNDGILPLNASSRIFVTGPGADNINVINGAWSRTWQGVDTTWNEARQQTILDVLRAKHSGPITHFAAVGYEEDYALPTMQTRFEAERLAKGSDAVVLCLAESPSTEKPGDIHSLQLPLAQRQLAEAVLNTGKPVIVVLTLNRPRIVSDFIDRAAAVVYTGLPGDFGPAALVDILHGVTNPSGRLPFTYPRYEGDMLTYDHKHTERLDTKFGMEAFNPQWHFGYGLSYTTYAYSDLTLSHDTLAADQSLTIGVKVTNSGQRAGKEVVQCYFSDRYASITPSFERLRAFEKRSIEPQATELFSFDVAASELSFIGLDRTPTLENGWYDVRIGALRDSVYLTVK